MGQMIISTTHFVSLALSKPRVGHFDVDEAGKGHECGVNQGSSIVDEV